MSLELADARLSSHDRAMLRRLFPLYIHDLSPHTTFYIMDARGRWRPELWRDWLSNAHIDPWLIKRAGEVIGFAIVGHQPFPYMTVDAHHKLCEFFILAPHRRRGLGRDAAVEVFTRHPGRWELTVLPTNTAAYRFWRSTLDTYTRGRFEELQFPGDTMMRFESPPR